MKKKQDKRATRPRKLDDKQLETVRGGNQGGGICACDDWESPVV